MILIMTGKTTRGVRAGGHQLVLAQVHMLMNQNLHLHIGIIVNMQEHTLIHMAVQFITQEQWEIL